MSLNDKKKVIVVGAGIVGVSTAVWLQRDGHDVVMVDRAEPGEGTSFGNGGVLASCAIVPVTGPGLLWKAPFMLLDRDQPLFMKWGYLPRLAPWLLRYIKHNNEADTRRIAAALAPIIGDSLEDHLALAAGTEAARYVVPGDYVYVYKKRADYESEGLSWDIRRKHGFEWRELSADELQSVAPGLDGQMTFGIALPGHGRITDPGQHVKALARHVCSHGGSFIRGNVDDLEIANGQVRGVIVNGELLPADHVVLATGVWSNPLMKRLGLEIPLESERGYHMEFWNPSEMPNVPLMLSSGKFVVTPMEGRIRAAGVLEFGGLQAPPSQAPFDLLERQFRRAFPGITYDRVEKWMGHRPATTDSIPVIGAVSGVAGCHVGFGHHHVGLTGGPKTGQILAQLVSGKKSNIDLAPYSPMRFS